VHWSGSAALDRALSDPSRPAALLYPGAGAIDIMAHPPSTPLTLVVIDGTWSQTRKVVRENPDLGRLPRYAFTPPSPSEYRIRREPDVQYVSTIEALLHVLTAIEEDGERFQALLAPFRAMVDMQIDHRERLHGGRTRHARKKERRTTRQPTIPTCLRDRREDLVCVVAEANAWPYRSRGQKATYPDELVHWVAHRLATGETFDFVLAPRNPLSPKTPFNIGLSVDVLSSGRTPTDLMDAWRAFVRDTDIICSWGHYGTTLFVGCGGFLPATRLDLRQIGRAHTKRSVGTAEDFVASIGGEPVSPLASGRAGLRLARAATITRYFSSLVE
jgi:hypothetical protein